MSNNLRKQRYRQTAVLLALVIVLAVGCDLALIIGPSHQPLAVVSRVLGDGLRHLLLGEPLPQTSAHTIVLDIRLPRLFLACIVGACLALAGAIMQALFQNPMADPYILGISSGAALGAVVAMMLGIQVAIAGLTAVPLLSFSGALLITALVYILSQRGGHIHTATLLLTGIALGSLVSAITSFIMLTGEEDLQVVISWLLGSISGRRWLHVYVAAPQLLAGGVVALVMARPLNVLLLGDETAMNLGVNVHSSKRILLAAASLLAAAAVSVSGIIGFVGLIIPHIARLLVGPDHRVLLPTSALAGAVLVVLADVLARVVIAPAELPIGIITAILGCPFFLYLLHRQSYGHTP